MIDIVERLRDLHKQATVEHSHYYVGNCALDAADRIETLEAALKEAGTMWIRKDNRIAALEADRATYNEWAAEIKIGVVCLNERIKALEAANSEAAIKSAAMKTGIVIHRQDYGDFISDGPVNLSRFVRYLLAPEQDKMSFYVVGEDSELAPRKELDDANARIEALEAALAEAQQLVTEANNSLYGSQGYFHSLNGGPFNKYHLAEGIETLKASSNRNYHRIEALEAALRHASSHLADLEYHYHGDREAMWKPIRAALAPEQDKCE